MFWYCAKEKGCSWECGLVTDKQEAENFIKRTFSPGCRYETFDFAVKGKTYKERKESIRKIAKEFWTYIFPHNTFYGSELAIIDDYFWRYGKRYGLIKEFLENGVILQQTGFLSQKKD